MFIPAFMVHWISSTEKENINWVTFFISPLGAQVVIHLVVAISLYIGSNLLPEKWLPNFINNALSMPLLIIAMNN